MKVHPNPEQLLINNTIFLGKNQSFFNLSKYINTSVCNNVNTNAPKNNTFNEYPIKIPAIKAPIPSPIHTAKYLILLNKNCSSFLRKKVFKG